METFQEYFKTFHPTQPRNPETTGCGKMSMILVSLFFPMYSQISAINNVDSMIINKSVGNATSTGSPILYRVFAHKAAKMAAMMSGPEILMPIFDFHEVMIHVIKVDMSCTAIPIDKEGAKSGLDV